jgi:hypothetical protein
MPSTSLVLHHSPWGPPLTAFPSPCAGHRASPKLGAAPLIATPTPSSLESSRVVAALVSCRLAIVPPLRSVLGCIPLSGGCAVVHGQPSWTPSLDRPAVARFRQHRTACASPEQALRTLCVPCGRRHGLSTQCVVGRDGLGHAQWPLG